MTAVADRRDEKNKEIRCDFPENPVSTALHRSGGRRHAETGI